MKLPRDLSGRDVFKALRFGFAVVRQEGSHIRMQREATRITIPNHKAIAPKTLQSLVRQAGMTIEALREAL
ncbi:MAG: type II toxin-antitoxin system HicA family toxin [Verrucomicrobiota bacterium]|nr:type II toxin-antitoxin system HicA family toxin [Verrucomicrobiota bacterium]